MYIYTYMHIHTRIYNIYYRYSILPHSRDKSHPGSESERHYQVLFSKGFGFRIESSHLLIQLQLVKGGGFHALNLQA